jgi:hypothetical protein
MRTRSAMRTRKRLPVLVLIVVLLWLAIGIIAVAQRGYFKGSSVTCAKTGTIIVTVISGPLNYVGVNPKITCALPQPSK